jgi:hypothetical protein
VLTKRAIKVGEELLITYVNPKMGYKARREELRAWGFGRCRCERCVEEERMALVHRKAGGGGEEAEQEREERERRVQEELDDMVRELKANLGVV